MGAGRGANILFEESIETIMISVAIPNKIKLKAIFPKIFFIVYVFTIL